MFDKIINRVFAETYIAIHLVMVCKEKQQKHNISTLHKSFSNCNPSNRIYRNVPKLSLTSQSICQCLTYKFNHPRKLSLASANNQTQTDCSAVLPPTPTNTSSKTASTNLINNGGQSHHGTAIKQNYRTDI